MNFAALNFLPGAGRSARTGAEATLPSPHATGISPAVAADENIGALTGIRFLAALWIVLEHYHTTHSEQMQHPIIALGYGAVTFFLMLSGFFLTRAYLFKDGLRARDFWWSRFVRMYPLYIISGLAMVPIAYQQYTALQHGDPVIRVLQDIFCYATLCQAWTFWHWNLNVPAWTVSAFAFFYVLFPTVGAWLKRRSTPGLWLAAALLLATALALSFLLTGVMAMAGEALYANAKSASVSGFSTAIVRFAHNFPLMRMPEFACGMVLAMLAKRDAIPGWLCRHGFLIGAVMVATLIWLAPDLPYLVMNNALFIIPSAAIILGSLHRHAWLEATLGHPWMGLLGRASFSLYLLHIPLLAYLRLGCAALALPTAGPAFELGFLALAVPLSLVAYYAVEEPIRLALRKFGPAKPGQARRAQGTLIVTATSIPT